MNIEHDNRENTENINNTNNHHNENNNNNDDDEGAHQHHQHHAIIDETAQRIQNVDVFGRRIILNGTEINEEGEEARPFLNAGRVPRCIIGKRFSNEVSEVGRCRIRTYDVVNSTDTY